MDRRFWLGQISRNAYIWAQVSADGEVALLPPTLASSPDLGPVARFTTRSPLVRDSQNRAGTKPSLPSKVPAALYNLEGGFLPARAAGQNFFTRFARFARLTLLYSHVFVFQDFIPAALLPRFHATTLFFLLSPLRFFQKKIQKIISVNINS